MCVASKGCGFLDYPMLVIMHSTLCFFLLPSLFQCAEERQVRLMVDAEQTYFQPAIRHIVVYILMPKYNRERPVVFNTVQCYLKVQCIVHFTNQ